MPPAVAALNIGVGPCWGRRVETCLRRWHALPLRCPTRRRRALPLAEMVPFHSIQAAGSKFPSKVLWTKFEIVLEGSNRFKKGIWLGCSRKGVAHHQAVTKSQSFTFGVRAISAESPCSEATFIVNSESNTGARPSARLCVGLKGRAL